MTKLSIPRSKPKLVEKILQLGLVEDKRELWRKRQSRSRGSGSGRGASDDFVDYDGHLSSADERLPSGESDGTHS